MVRVLRRPGWRAGVPGVPRVSGVLSGQRDGGPAGQGACGRAVIRVHAAAMAATQGQVAAILSGGAFRRTSRPAACRMRMVFGSALARSPSSCYGVGPPRLVRLRDGNILISDQFNDQVIEINKHKEIVFVQGKIQHDGRGST